jgi:hypothetical protein
MNSWISKGVIPNKKMLRTPQFNHLMIAIGKLDVVAFEIWALPAKSIAKSGLPARPLGPL